MSVTKNHPKLITAVFFGIAAALAPGLSVAQQGGQPQVAPSRADAQLGQPYNLGTFEDWSVRCVRAEDERQDPCEMNQLLTSADGNPTAEINLFTVGQTEVEAGATVITPLETLLPRGLRMSVDGGEARSYPFQLCTRQGCVAQIGLRPGEVEALKAGSTAVLTIFPAAAPDTPVELTVSLAGFTAAYTMLSLP
ncbi:invasion associated locus B family protein [Meridianimarinicoccus roseus]|jgi:invasion protein IalB|uniref:Invasion associated locus B family protein n=1 Tax=Meridianimarinicoccus roseus TaxID=2072018 RepID=A0A2V2LGN0_9RHOB|nr:invasion associated locus B family protein [Meridianimarinicoccus roseus]PWR04645.1 invasion associated locus B family protein [Meridianimarinicoccus roseus]